MSGYGNNALFEYPAMQTVFKKERFFRIFAAGKIYELFAKADKPPELIFDQADIPQVDFSSVGLLYTRKDYSDRNIHKVVKITNNVLAGLCVDKNGKDIYTGIIDGKFAPVGIFENPPFNKFMDTILHKDEDIYRDQPDYASDKVTIYKNNEKIGTVNIKGARWMGLTGDNLIIGHYDVAGSAKYQENQYENSSKSEYKSAQLQKFPGTYWTTSATDENGDTHVSEHSVARLWLIDVRVSDSDKPNSYRYEYESDSARIDKYEIYYKYLFSVFNKKSLEFVESFESNFEFKQFDYFVRQSGSLTEFMPVPFIIDKSNIGLDSQWDVAYNSSDTRDYLFPWLEGNFGEDTYQQWYDVGGSYPAPWQGLEAPTPYQLRFYANLEADFGISASDISEGDIELTPTQHQGASTGVLANPGGESRYGMLVNVLLWGLPRSGGIPFSKKSIHSYNLVTSSPHDVIQLDNSFISEGTNQPEQPAIGAGYGLIVAADHLEHIYNFDNPVSGLQIYNKDRKKIGEITQEQLGLDKTWTYSSFSPWDLAITPHFICVIENKNSLTDEIGWREDGMKIYFYPIKIKYKDKIAISVELNGEKITHNMPEDYKEGVYLNGQNSRRAMAVL